MRNAGLEEAQDGIQIAGRNMNNLRYADDTTLMAESEEELKSLLMKLKGESEKVDLKLNIQKTKIVAILCTYCFAHRWDYNALLSGEETAISLGIHVKRLTLVGMVLCCLTSSVVVSNVGLISFIGLVAPHIVRMVVGNNHVYLIPGSILGGATLLLLGDLFARTVISPVILPIGAITSFLGGPLFLYLLFKGGKKQ